MGLTAADVAADDVEVWPCNWSVVNLFIALRTQWRIGYNGPTGLDYSAVPTVARWHNITLTKKRVQALQIMEAEALRMMAEQRK